MVAPEDRESAPSEDGAKKVCDGTHTAAVSNVRGKLPRDTLAHQCDQISRVVGRGMLIERLLHFF